MGKWVGTALLCTLFVGVSAMYLVRIQRKPASAQPVGQIDSDAAANIRFEPASVELGSQLWGQTVPISVTLSHSGDTAVRVKSVSTSCGCTAVAGLEVGKSLEPGEIYPLSVELDTQHEPGRKTRYVNVTLESGEKAKLAILVDVYATYTLSQRAVNLGNVDITDSASLAAQSIWFESDSVTLVGEPRVDSDWLKARLAPRDGGKVEILLSVIKSKLPFGDQRAKLTMSTSDPTVPTTAVFVRARGYQPLEPQPARAYLIGADGQRVRFVLAESEEDAATLVWAGTDDDTLVVKLAEDGQVEIVNPSGRALGRNSFVHMKDDKGRKGRVLVSTFDE